MTTLNEETGQDIIGAPSRRSYAFGSEGAREMSESVFNKLLICF